jgi:hypothetical protein
MGTVVSLGFCVAGFSLLGLTRRPRPGRVCTRLSHENPLGGAQAEGFGMGVNHEEPTPALRATPPKRGLIASLAVNRLRRQAHR